MEKAKSTATPPKLTIEIHQHWTEFGNMAFAITFTVARVVRPTK